MPQCLNCRRDRPRKGFAWPQEVVYKRGVQNSYVNKHGVEVVSPSATKEEALPKDFIVIKYCCEGPKV